MRKISLITGVAGSIGSNLAELLLKNNHLVYGIDNFTLGKKKNLEPFIKNKNFFFKKISLDKKKNTDIINKFLSKKVDYVWLLAANSDISKGIKNSNLDYKNTFLTTLNTLVAIKYKVKKKTKIFFTSSSAVYGQANLQLSEKTYSFNPISNYGKYKLYSEFFLKSFAKIHNIKILILRLPNVTGAPFTHGILHDFYKKFKNNNRKLKILGDGNQLKPYCSTKELVNCLFFLSKKNLAFDTLLIGPNDNGIKVKDIADIFREATNKKLKLIFEKKSYGWTGDVPTYCYSVKKLNRLGYRFKNSSEKTIINSINELFDS